MKIFYKNLKCTFLFTLFAFLFNQAQSQQVTNVAAKQDGKKIIITYTLTGKQDVNEYDVKFFVSTNGGINWEQLTNGITGDVGAKVTPGSLKTITWDVLATRDKLQGDNVKFKITATYNSNKAISTYKALTDSRDGKIYKIAKIGTQIWMSENLNFSTGNGSWCYENNTSNCNKYGRLYDWETAKKVCPGGWHLPSDAEWSTLTNFVGSDNGKKLKSSSGWIGSANGTDTFGFAGLPGGYRRGLGTFYGVGSYGNWWSSTEGSTGYAWYRYLDYSNDKVNRGNYDGKDGLSVRCIRDL